MLNELLVSHNVMGLTNDLRVHGHRVNRTIDPLVSVVEDVAPATKYDVRIC
jgi:hypothetical protein